jgi:hypothetical protein
MLWLMALAAGLLAFTHRDPGPGTWENAQARAFTGIVAARPYPVLFAEDRGDGRPGPMLLVEVGKHGAASRAANADGQRVTLTGWPLRRDGRLMLELEPGDPGVQPAPPAPPAAQTAPLLAAARPVGHVKLRGEIVDAKCYLGAMKPGEGRTHKECATLCIAGGIPPVLVCRDAAGNATHYLLADAAGGPLGDDLLPLVGEPVETAGELEARGPGLWVLRVDTKDIHRIK